MFVGWFFIVVGIERLQTHFRFVGFRMCFAGADNSSTGNWSIVPFTAKLNHRLDDNSFKQISLPEATDYRLFGRGHGLIDSKFLTWTWFVRDFGPHWFTAPFRQATTFLNEERWHKFCSRFFDKILIVLAHILVASQTCANATKINIIPLFFWGGRSEGDWEDLLMELDFCEIDLVCPRVVAKLPIGPEVEFAPKRFNSHPIM